jgi:hypothetical protein
VSADPRACPTCGLWQRTAKAASVCLDPVHDPQRPDGGHGPEAGHTFEITWRLRGSSAVVGEPHFDSEDWSEPITQQVRAWSLREALARAQTIPLHVWMGDSYDDEPEGDTVRAIVGGVE